MEASKITQQQVQNAPTEPEIQKISINKIKWVQDPTPQSILERNFAKRQVLLQSSSDESDDDAAGQEQMQRQSKFGGEEDPSVDEEKHDTYDELSESDDDNLA